MRKIASLAALSLAASVTLVATTGTAHAADRAVVLTQGHIDLFNVTYDNATSGLRLQVKDDTGDTPVLREPSDVTIAVDEEAAALEVPEGLPADFDFLGAPGTVIYDLPQNQAADLPWPGWSTETLVDSLPAGTTLAAGQPVELAVEVEGPGEVHTFMNGPTGNVINHYIDTTDEDPDVIPVAASAHVHTEWVFTELGEYTLDVTPTARTSGGTTITGTPASYHFRIGDPAPLGLQVTPNKANATYLYGQGITLDATPTAPTALNHYHWFIRRAGEPAFAISSRSSSAQLKLPTSLVWDGAQVYASLYDHDHQVVASSEPLTLDVSALPEVTKLTAHTDKASYAVGDVAQLSSSQDPQTTEDHFHWYVKKPSEEFYTYIPGSDQATATLPITAELDGATVLARLFDTQHAVIAESDPVALTIGDGVETPADTALRISAPTRQVFGARTPATVKVRATTDGGPAAGTVDIKLGSLVIGKGVKVDATGLATARAPRTLRIGKHALSATFTPADAAAQAPSRATSGSITVVKAPSAARIALRDNRIRPRERGVVVVRVTLPYSSGVAVNGSALVYDGSRRIAVGKVVNGRATIALPRLRAGRHSIAVVYGGSTTTVKATSARAVLTVRR